MKKYILLCSFFAICISTINAQEQLPINTSYSSIKWSCDYSFYFSGHYGIVNFKEGHFVKSDGKITGGTFTIDLNTLEAQDMNAEGNQSLTDHLKDPDFFDVKKFSTATLVIKRTRYHNATDFEAEADLTIKGIVQTVKFQAKLDFEAKTMKTKFKIDRTLWGINYNSKLKDKAISDAIGFEVLLSL